MAGKTLSTRQLQWETGLRKRKVSGCEHPWNADPAPPCFSLTQSPSQAGARTHSPLHLQQLLPPHTRTSTPGSSLLPLHRHSHLRPDPMLAAPSSSRSPNHPTSLCPHRDGAGPLQTRAEGGLPAPPGSTHTPHRSHWVLWDRLPAPSSCPSSRWGCQFISSPAQTNSRAI